jgi:hypothetical protein
MKHALVLGRCAPPEVLRTPKVIISSLFIPLFFLVVNVGQAARIFSGSTTAFLHGARRRRLPAAGSDSLSTGAGRSLPTSFHAFRLRQQR